MANTVQHIFRQSFHTVAAGSKLPPHFYKAARQFSRCRTTELGGHIQACPEGHVERVWYNSCRHRSCPQCNQIQTERWLERQRARLLDCPHHHLIFTLPHELNPLWLLNSAVLMQRLFQTVRDVLTELLADPKYLGAEPGLLLALHTWGRSLSLHPHIHFLITDGGLAGEQWQHPKGSCFLPARVVMAKFRGKFLWTLRCAIQRGELKLPGEASSERCLNLLNKLGRRKWNVHLRERYDHGAGVMHYLARYVRGGPLRNGQLIAVNETQVKYRYFAHHDGNAGGKQASIMTLKPAAFIRRYLQHVPEPGRHTVRAYGLYATTKVPALNHARTLFQQPPLAPPAPLTWQAYFQRHTPQAGVHGCRVCGALLARTRLIQPSHGPPQQSSHAGRPLYA